MCTQPLWPSDSVNSKPCRPRDAEPFLRWPGGKRWVAPVLAGIVRKSLFGKYIEPFLGGGAVFFRVGPEEAVLGDINPNLIDTYTAIRDTPHEVIELLRGWVATEEMFYRLRHWNPAKREERAARFLFLNRTAFAGIYRENREGRYNVPFGGGQRTHHLLFESDLLLRASTALASARLVSGDFSALVGCAGQGDVIYCDPPYPSTLPGAFSRYNGRRFSWDDQVRLARAVRAAHDRGATVLVSNAREPRVEELYEGAQMLVLERSSLVSRTRAGRGPVSEVLFVFEPGSGGTE